MQERTFHFALFALSLVISVTLVLCSMALVLSEGPDIQGRKIC